jgi:hypothetical protein
MDEYSKRQKAAGVVLLLVLVQVVLIAGFTQSDMGPESSGAFVDVRTSDIVGGDAFLEGSTIEIQYAVESEVAGQVKFKVDGANEVVRDVAVGDTGATQQTFTYRADDLGVGNHTYQAVFEAADGNSYRSVPKEITVVESRQDLKTGTEPRTDTRPAQPTDPPVSFGRDFEREYFPRFGFKQEKTFPIINNREEDLLVEVEVPASPSCQYVQVQESPARSADFGKVGNYELPPADEGVRKVQTRKEFQVRFLIPEEEVWNNNELDEIECEVRVNTGASSQTQTMVLKADPSSSVLARSLGGFRRSVVSGEAVSVGGVSLSPLITALLVLGILFLLGVIAARLDFSPREFL